MRVKATRFWFSSSFKVAGKFKARHDDVVFYFIKEEYKTGIAKNTDCHECIHLRLSLVLFV